ncbi:MAG: hypothetical protein BRC25_00110 [Parcubacteria group bacterium SW_6_46_9]|nr:MAG: hypothetical protein BRC25_00110 [Parcubacteria group bacterium SW_6_46_9]
MKCKSANEKTGAVLKTGYFLSQQRNSNQIYEKHIDMDYLRNIKTVALVASFFGLLLLSPLMAFGQEQITDFQTDIQIEEDSSLTVTEEITYDFASNEQHGIFRDITTDTGSRRIFIDVSTVQRDGSSEQYSVSREDGNKRIKIGDPDKTITGKHTYTITYEVRGALNFFPDRAELYWDVVGDQWEVPISSASTTVQLPEQESVSAEDLETRCFVGEPGSTSSCAVTSISEDPARFQAKTDRVLTPGSAKTVVVNFPDSLVTQPGWITWVGWPLSANPFVVLPLVVLILGFFLWWRWGKDPAGRGTIVPQYEPPEGLKPILVGSLIDEKVHTQDVTAGIIYLAQQGYIAIEREKAEGFFGDHDYVLHQKKDFDDAEDIYQDLGEAVFSVESSSKDNQSWWQSWFGGVDENQRGQTDIEAKDSVRLSDLKQSRRFQKTIKSIKSDAKQAMKDRGWFAKRHTTATSVLGIVLVGLFALSFIFGNSLSAVGFVSVIVAMFIAVFWLILMKKKTKKGAVLQEKLEGFKQFLTMTQEKRLDFHNAPERNPEEFMRFLPYAIALGVEEKWAKQFADMDMPEPDWYYGGSAGAFAADDFASDMNSFSQDYSQAASGSSGTSGGAAAFTQPYFHLQPRE